MSLISAFFLSGINENLPPNQLRRGRPARGVERPLEIPSPLPALGSVKPLEPGHAYVGE